MKSRQLDIHSISQNRKLGKEEKKTPNRIAQQLVGSGTQKPRSAPVPRLAAAWPPKGHCSALSTRRCYDRAQAMLPRGRGWPQSHAPARGRGRQPSLRHNLHHLERAAPPRPCRSPAKSQPGPSLSFFLCAFPMLPKIGPTLRRLRDYKLTYIYTYTGMCACKQTYPPYVYTRLCNVNRHSTRWLAELLAERSASALDGFGLRLSPAGAWHVKAIVPGSRAARGTVTYPSPAAAPWPPACCSSSTSTFTSKSESKTTAANAQQKGVSESCRLTSNTAVPPAHPAPTASQLGEVVPGPQHGAQTPPDHLSSRHWSGEEPVAGMVQLPPPPELLQQRATDPNLA